MGDTCDNQSVTEADHIDETDVCVTVCDQQNCSPEMITVLPPVSEKKGGKTKSM